MHTLLATRPAPAPSVIDFGTESSDTVKIDVVLCLIPKAPKLPKDLSVLEALLASN